MIDASAYLIGFAVAAYCRAILHSNVRGRLTDHIEVPAELMEIHRQVKTFWNATIAHSQSELSVVAPAGVLDAQTLEVRFVAGATVISTFPWLWYRSSGRLSRPWRNSSMRRSSRFERAWSASSEGWTQ